MGGMHAGLELGTWVVVVGARRTRAEADSVVEAAAETAAATVAADLAVGWGFGT